MEAAAAAEGCEWCRDCCAALPSVLRCPQCDKLAHCVCGLRAQFAGHRFDVVLLTRFGDEGRQQSVHLCEKMNISRAAQSQDSRGTDERDSRALVETLLRTAKARNSNVGGGAAESQLKRARVEGEELRLCCGCLEHQEVCAKVLNAETVRLAAEKACDADTKRIDLSLLTRALLMELRAKGLFQTKFDVPCQVWCKDDSRQSAFPPDAFAYADSTTAAVCSAVQSLADKSPELFASEGRSVDEQRNEVMTLVSRAAAALPGSEYQVKCDAQCHSLAEPMQCIWCASAAKCDKQRAYLFGHEGGRVCRWCHDVAAPFDEDVYYAPDTFNVDKAISQCQQEGSVDELDFPMIAGALVRQVHEAKPAFRNFYMIESLGVRTIKKRGADGLEHSSFGAFALIKNEEPIAQEIPNVIIKWIETRSNLDSDAVGRLIEKAKQKLTTVDWITPVLLDIGKKHLMAKKLR